MNQYNFIFFDLDGTLVNTVEGTAKSAEYALKYFGIQPTKDVGKIFCGPPLKQSFEKFGLKGEQIDKAIKLYRKYQAENTIELSQLYNGIYKLLNNLKNQHKTLIVVTAKYQEIAIKILEYVGIYKFFDSVYGATGSNQNKVDLLRNAIYMEDIRIEECVMIGDRKSDIIAGKSNNMDTIGVLYGMDSNEIFQEVGATYVAESAEKILEILTAKCQQM